MLLYHGSGTSTKLETLVTNDIVLTTFETVSSDFTRSGALRSISWFRIVLDEGTFDSFTYLQNFHGKGLTELVDNSAPH